MAIKTIYGFDEDGKKVPIGTYNDVLTVTLARDDMDSTVSCDGVVSNGFYSGGSWGSESPLVTEYDSGDSCTLTATKTGPQSFANWQTLDGTVISTSNPYTFTVTENVTIIGHFQSASPKL